MLNCKLVRLLFKIFPFPFGRYALLERHIWRCPECSKAAADVREAERVTIPFSAAKWSGDPWPDFVRRLAQDAQFAHSRRRTFWRLAAAVSGVAAAAVVLWLVLVPPPKLPEPDFKLRLENLELYGVPGKAIIFQGQDPNTTFIWVEKS